MPGIPAYDPLDPTANMRRVTGFSVGFVSVGGSTYSMRVGDLGGGFEISIGQKMAVVDACGALSNMGAYRLTEDKVTDIRIADAQAVDEAYAAPSEVLVMHFENDNMEKKTIDIPAPDAMLFEQDGVTLKSRTDATVGTLVGTAIDALETAINSTFVPDNSYQFVRGVRRTRKITLPNGQQAVPQVVEGSGALEGPAA